MPAELRTKVPPLRNLIAMDDEFEVKYWTKHLGVSRDELQRAVDKVGKFGCLCSQRIGKDPSRREPQVIRLKPNMTGKWTPPRIFLQHTAFRSEGSCSVVCRRKGYCGVIAEILSALSCSRSHHIDIAQLNCLLCGRLWAF